MKESETESDNESIRSSSEAESDSDTDVRHPDSENEDSDAESDTDVRYSDSETVYAKHTYKSNSIGILSVQPIYYHKENKDAAEADIRIFCALCGTISCNEELHAYCPCKRIWIHPSCTVRCVRVYRGVSYTVPIQCPYCFTK